MFLSQGCFTRLASLASAIGLRINRDKTVICGPLGDALAPSLGVESVIGWKCLGSWISPSASSTQKFLAKAVKAHQPFFESLAHLS